MGAGKQPALLSHSAEAAVQEVGSSRVGSAKGFPGRRRPSSRGALTRWGGGAPWVCFIRALIPAWGLHPQDPVTPRGPTSCPHRMKGHKHLGCPICQLSSLQTQKNKTSNKQLRFSELLGSETVDEKLRSWIDQRHHEKALRQIRTSENSMWCTFSFKQSKLVYTREFSIEYNKNQDI